MTVVCDAADDVVARVACAPDVAASAEAMSVLSSAMTGMLRDVRAIDASKSLVFITVGI